ncbi:MAG: metal-dependent transcriptional regulator [Candidatus Methanomethylicia archaeon]
MSEIFKHKRIEDYLIAIYSLMKISSDGWVNNSSLAEFLGVSKSTTTEAVQRLNNIGLCNYVPYRGVKLTIEGENLAFKYILKREILECLYNYLLKFNIDEKVISEICSIEHYIDDKSVFRICKVLNIPSQCPHGNPLPCNNICLNGGKCPLEV